LWGFEHLQAIQILIAELSSRKECNIFGSYNSTPCIYARPSFAVTELLALHTYVESNHRRSPSSATAQSLNRVRNSHYPCAQVSRRRCQLPKSSTIRPIGVEPPNRDIPILDFRPNFLIANPLGYHVYAFTNFGYLSRPSIRRDNARCS